ncbi:hypothetical protein AB834_01215 [PVC group bacterium (ex Bugula neritina AB1)]|nr:hypothetical protein AB834_01215 [PVC group bacterium (ex Bugula neritina AB1)]
MKNFIVLFCSLLTIFSSSNLQSKPLEKENIHIIKSSDLEWEPLVPALGTEGPLYAPLWGNIHKKGASGFLAKMPDGYVSSPHVHNITYRGVTISGLVHNDDPGAEKAWLSPGSIWMQPAGEVHVTAAKGKCNIAYLEMNEGPYLFDPPSDAFTPPFSALNIDSSHLIWLNQKHSTWLPSRKSKRVKNLAIAFLWGKVSRKHWNSTLLRLPPDFYGKITNRKGDLKIVVIKGEVTLGKTKNEDLPSGSYFHLEPSQSSFISNETDENVLLYIKSKGKYKVY